MARRDCDICRGSGCIILPVYHRLSMGRVGDADMRVASASLVDTRREYPCPECSDRVDETRVALVTAQHDAPSIYRNEPGFMEHVSRTCARALVDQINTGGFISIKTGPVDERSMTFRARATLGVISKTAVASLEDRVAARQFDMAEKVVAEAKRLISVWGRDYGDENILKSRAYSSVNEALAVVAAKRSDKQER